MRYLLPVFVTALLAAAPSQAQLCVGDCSGDNEVDISELIRGVNISLGTSLLSDCRAADANMDGRVAISELVLAVRAALFGCPPGPTPTVDHTATGTPTSPPEPTPTPESSCPIQSGSYTMIQTEGGTLNIPPFGEFPFPVGGEIIQDVRPGDADCVHETVVPFPGGFTAPVFCLPALSFTASVEQTGCGVGQLDSDGGSDYTVTEIGDSSDASAPCDIPHLNCASALMDSAQRLDITVGDGNADVCQTGTANIFVTVPVITTVWFASGCPDPDSTFDGDADELVLQFSHTLDFTTDKATSKWEDIDGNGCMTAPSGPPDGLSVEGTCLDLASSTGTLAASGTVASGSLPVFDINFSAVLPGTFSGPGQSLDATCSDPPDINLMGKATRCIE